MERSPHTQGPFSCSTRPRSAGASRLHGLLLLVCGLLQGCAALSNPVANGLPVRRVPPALLGEPTEDKKTIPLSSLRQRPPDQYRLAPGDVLGIWIEPGVFATGTDPRQPGGVQPPPVQISERQGGTPALGYPIPVLEDGTILLPLIAPLKVEGMTIPQAREAVRKAYLEPKENAILNAEVARFIVTLLRPRRYEVLVVRQDSGGLTFGESGVLGGTKRGTGAVVSLPAYENDVLHALAQTGGLPGLDARNEVLIERGAFRTGPDAAAALRDHEPLPLGCDPSALPDGPLERLVVRIPLRLRPGEPLPFRPDDVVLQTGDIVFIEARDLEVWYSGGLLPPREFVLPRDRDLDVLEAVAQAGFPVVTGGVFANSLSGSITAAGIGSPPPSLVTVLRRTPGGGQVPIRVDLNRALRDPRERILIQPGDVVVLQETVGQALARYVTQVFRFNAFYNLFQSSRATGTTTLAVP